MSVMNTVDVAVKGLADLDKLVPVLQAPRHSLATCNSPPHQRSAPATACVQ